MKLKLKKKKGFTLIELLVVVIIIGVLSAIALPQYFKALDKARFVQVLTFTDALYRAEQSYFLLNNEYTMNMSALDVDIPNIKDTTCEISVINGSRRDYVSVCRLYKNNNLFIVLEKYFQSGQEICVTYPASFAGDELCKSAMNTSTYSDHTSWRVFSKKGYQ